MIMPASMVGELQRHGVAEVEWKAHAEEGKSPVGETYMPSLESHLSTAGHVKPGRNPRGPPRKAKYFLVTDSELVP